MPIYCFVPGCASKQNKPAVTKRFLVQVNNVKFIYFKFKHFHLHVLLFSELFLKSKIFANANEALSNHQPTHAKLLPMIHCNHSQHVDWLWNIRDSGKTGRNCKSIYLWPWRTSVERKQFNRISRISIRRHRLQPANNKYSGVGYYG